MTEMSSLVIENQPLSSGNIFQDQMKSQMVSEI